MKYISLNHFDTKGCVIAIKHILLHLQLQVCVRAEDESKSVNEFSGV